MFGLGIWEFALILVVGLLVLGPEKLPKVARQLGRIMRELRRAVGEFQTSLATADMEEEREKRAASAAKRIEANARPVEEPEQTTGTEQEQTAQPDKDDSAS